MKKIIISFALALATMTCFAQTEQKATVWGVKSDGITDNTGSIQRAVDYISEHGGGTLVFYVGRYVTGAIELKSNVTIRLEEAAVLVGSTNVYDYKGAPALVWSDGAENACLTGKGVVECRHSALAAFIASQKEKGFLPENFSLPGAFSGISVGEDIKVLENTAASTQYNK